MILLDTSILIGYRRRRDPAVRRMLSRPDVGVCGVTRAEVLHGARTPADVDNINATLDEFAQVLTPETVWPAFGENLAVLRRSGVTVPFPDALLATLAIYHDVEVWATDAHFGMIQSILPALRLFVPPPPSPTAPATP